MAAQRFGGAWTEDKLARIRKYLAAYTTALKNQPFRRLYIDAFAGSGYRTAKDARSEDLLPHLPAAGALAKGSARVALEVVPPFDRYIFIEKNKRHFDQLRLLESEFPQRRDKISFINKEANRAILDLCNEIDWRRNRAVMFLDPYGMQVNWNTIEVIAATKAIDLWYLFPAGIGVSRLIPRHGTVPEKWQNVLDRILPDKKWREALFVSSVEPDLIEGMRVTRRRTADITKIESYFLNHLTAIFAGVAPRALPLRNSKEQCMYLLTFACGNPKGARIAIPIAEAVLRE